MQKMSATFEARAAHLTQPHPEYDAKALAWEREQRALARREEMRNRRETIARQLPAGVRHATIDGYELYSDAQRAVVERIKRLLTEMPQHLENGGGLFCYGCCGTGKDHIAAVCIKRAAELGRSCCATNGMRLFGDIAAAWRNGQTEMDVLAPLLRCDVLLLSDPVLPTGNTDANQKSLYRLVNGRADAGRPTWATVNVAGREAAQDLLGPAVYSRLVFKALCLYCAWEDYRERQIVR